MRLVVAFKDYSHGIEVVHLLERQVLGLHFLVYGIYRLKARLGLVLYVQFVELGLDRGGEIGIYLAAPLLGGLDLVGDILIYVGVLVFETQVLKFGLDGEQAESVCQRGVYVECFSGNLIALVGRHRAEGAHIVESVGHLYQHHAYVLAHGQEQFAEVLGLYRRPVAEDAARYLGKSLYQLRYLGAEVLLDVLDGILGVFHHVVEQRRAYRRGAESYLLRRYLGHGNRVHYVWLAAAPADTSVGLLGKAVGALYHLDFLAVVAPQIAVHEVCEGLFDNAVFFLGA